MSFAKTAFILTLVTIVTLVTIDLYETLRNIKRITAVTTPKESVISFDKKIPSSLSQIPDHQTRDGSEDNEAKTGNSNELPLEKNQPQNIPQPAATSLTSLKTPYKAITEQTNEPAKTAIPSKELYGYVSSRVVNFFCDTGESQVVIATGTIIHPKGYVLTNAHVAENIKKQKCLLRKGSPARPFAYGELVFFPKNYGAAATTDENAAKDLSIWKITEPSGAYQFPDTFEYMEIDFETQLKGGESLSSFSYAAELLSYDVALRHLHLLFTRTTVTAFNDYFIESEESLSSQKGSSGGILVDRFNGKLRGLIFGVTKEETINDRSLISLTPQAKIQQYQQKQGWTF